MSGTDRRTKSKTMWIALNEGTAAVEFIRWGAFCIFPAYRISEFLGWGTQMKTLMNIVMIMYMTRRHKSVLWKIIHLREVKPVRRRLKRTIDILIIPTTG